MDEKFKAEETSASESEDSEFEGKDNCNESSASSLASEDQFEKKGLDRILGEQQATAVGSEDEKKLKEKGEKTRTHLIVYHRSWNENINISITDSCKIFTWVKVDSNRRKSMIYNQMSPSFLSFFFQFFLIFTSNCRCLLFAKYSVKSLLLELIIRCQRWGRTMY